MVERDATVGQRGECFIERLDRVSPGVRPGKCSRPVRVELGAVLLREHLGGLRAALPRGNKNEDTKKKGVDQIDGSH